ncbi:hypothetical protein A4X13_0g3544 [Tilletia indica]|uniref:Auxin efflux carrier n=1 Tax=Tilletia indica TaxID=43049 RepID=A0A177TTH8_9BASI|nr:hypothetical protein A4X13_0g3544 [Tilletia indica]
MAHQRSYSPTLEAWASQVAAAHSNHVAISATGTPVWALVKVIASSIIEVFLLSSVGYILARRGVIDKKTQTKINKLNVSFFTPALLFSKVAFTLNPARLAELYIVPIGFVIITVVSATGALLLSKIARLSKAQRNFAIACAMSPNSNSLPVALMQSLVVTVPQLRWNEEGQPKDTKDSMLGRALTYLVLFSTLGMLVRWSVGAKLLSSVEEADFNDDVEEDAGLTNSGNYRDEPEQERLIHFEEGDVDQRQTQQSSTSATTNSESQSPTDPIPPPITIRKPTAEFTGEGEHLLPSDALGRDKNGRADPRSEAWARSFPNSPNDSLPSPPNEPEDVPAPPPKKSFFRAYIVRPLAAVNRFMTMPLWAAILSLVVALISPLQKFIDSLEPVVGALKTAGACSIPLTMVVLGSYFYEDKAALQALGAQKAAAPTPQAAALQGSTRGSDDSLAGIQTGNSTLVEPSSNAHKRRSIPWIKNPWNSAPTSEAGSRGGSLSGSGTLGVSGSETQSDVGGDDATSVGTAAVSDGGPEGAHAQAAWSKLAERNAARNSRNGLAVSASNGQQGLSRRNWREEAKQKRMKTMERRTIVVAVASRMLLTPMILLPSAAWYAVATRYNVMDDPVFITCACLLIGSPPALTLAQITSQNASGNSGFERLISKTIFVSYAIMAAPTTIALVLTALLIAQYDH